MPHSGHQLFLLEFVEESLRRSSSSFMWTWCSLV